jgi:hypothetical protein
MPTWNWKQGDLAPSLLDTLYDGNNIIVDLTTAVSVKLVVKNVANGTVLINAAGVIVAPATNGQVRYDPISQDVAASGVFRADWQVTWTGGKVETFPVRRGNDDLLIVIAPKIV